MKEKHLKCIFFNRLGIKPDPSPCSGKLTIHHVQHRCEKGNSVMFDGTPNLVDLCEGHQAFVHQKSKWKSVSLKDL